MALADHLEGTRYGWFTPAYLARITADVVIWCSGSPPPGCRYNVIRRHEELHARFHPDQDLWLVPWRCPACGHDKVTFTVMVRQAGPQAHDSPYAMGLGPAPEVGRQQ